MADNLDWSDRTDDEATRRGFIATIDPCIIRNDQGEVIWDNERWSFLLRDAPETAHPSLWRQGRLNTAHGLFEVAPGIYQVRGFCVSNMTIVEGDEGVVIIDVLTSAEAAAAALALYREHRGDRPVRGVVFTHSHGDHFGGIRGVVPEGADGEVVIMAPEGFIEHSVSENVVAGPAMLWRATYMYGKWLDASPTGGVGFGLGQDLSQGSTSLVAPNRDITKTGQLEIIDGVRLEFQLTPDTEAPSELNVYLPDHRVLLVAENANHTLHNVLTLRGALIRDAKRWASYLNETIQLYGGRSDVLVGSHHWPTWGRDDLVAMLSQQRDAYAYIHDQTVRLMNRGLTSAEIAEELAEFPGALGRAWHARGYYGSLSHNSKAVYQRYMGWYDGNPAHLWPHPPTEAGRRYVELMGGADEVVAKARRAFDERDYRWVAELLNHVVFAFPDHAGARQLQAATFEQLAYGAENGVWRNFYLTGAKELRGELEVSTYDRPRRSRGMLRGLSTRQLLDVLAIRIIGEQAAKRDLAMRWQVGEETWTITLSNGVLTAVVGDAVGVTPTVQVTGTRAALESLIASDASLDSLRADGSLTEEGGRDALDHLASVIEPPVIGFPVATP